MDLPWEQRDPLTEALFQVRMSGAFYSWTEASGEGSVAMPRVPSTLSFHVVSRGTAFLEVDGEEPIAVRAGEMALVPRGIGHRVSTAPGARLLGNAEELPQTMLGDHFSVLRIGPDDVAPHLSLLCGVIAFDSPGAQQVLDVLPRVIRIDSAERPVMAALVPLLSSEVLDPRPGGEAVATRLADVLVVETVRAWLASDPEARTGWIAALRDPQIGVVLAAIHREPGFAWTLGDLASAAMMSRSAFAARFSAVVGIPAMKYVAGWRMRAARHRLAAGDTVASVALALGYGSEAAFSRAYARTTGETPGQVRRRAA
ncbi:AraC family transcriptional regulator [Microbacterium lacus]|uniref:AraC family transcriptional regulator n=1 Tax=Microbacterium lacus TaxID=415217 RepID=UPI00384FFC1B